MSKKYNFNTKKEKIEFLNKKNLLGKNSILKYNEEFLFLERNGEVETIKIKTPIEEKDFKIENAFIIDNVVQIKNNFVKPYFYNNDIENLNKEEIENIRKKIIDIMKNQILYYYSEDIDKIKELEDNKYLIRLNNINIDNYYIKEYEDENGLSKKYDFVYLCLF